MGNVWCPSAKILAEIRSPTVGGNVVPVNKLMLLLQYIGLGLAVAGVATLTAVILKRQREKGKFGSAAIGQSELAVL